MTDSPNKLIFSSIKLVHYRAEFYDKKYRSEVKNRPILMKLLPFYESHYGLRAMSMLQIA